jgi:DNA-binding transcriptional MocR family regulator
MSELEQYQRRGRRSSQSNGAARGDITGASAREIAASAEAAIREGRLDTGDQLPTVRELARTLGTSPATVNSAYRVLRQRGLVVAEGRRGTRVAPRPALRAPMRPAPLPEAIMPGLRDLTIGLPDPSLLPPLTVALRRVELEPKLAIGGLDVPDPDLLALARKGFTVDGLGAGAIAVCSGALDAIERVLQAHLRPGDRVVVEDPAYPSIRDILLALGLMAVPVAVDEFGMIPQALQDGLTDGAEAMVIVPRAQNPLGSALDTERIEALRGVLARHPRLLLVEDDHAGPVAGAPFATLVTADSERWAVIRSMSKILHPDVRLALVAGDETTIARVEGRQALGVRWVSHLLQALAAEMLRDPRFADTCARAAAAYATRRQALIGALADRGVEAHGRSGMNVWVAVREEAPVVRALLDAGWLVLAGEHFRIRTPPGLRVTVSTLHDGEADEIARVIASVEHAGRPRRAY